jgi:signal transduction histidine kinase
LSICQHIAKVHGGITEVESQVGQGSTFSVFLPLFEKS